MDPSFHVPSRRFSKNGRCLLQLLDSVQCMSVRKTVEWFRIARCYSSLTHPGFQPRLTSEPVLELAFAKGLNHSGFLSLYSDSSHTLARGQWTGRARLRTPRRIPDTASIQRAHVIHESQSSPKILNANGQKVFDQSRTSVGHSLCLLFRLHSHLCSNKTM